MASWGPESSNNHRRRLPTGATTSKKHKKLLWAHVTAQDVNSALSGLLENTVVVLPESCVQAGGIQPNINDKNKPKRLVRTCLQPTKGHGSRVERRAWIHLSHTRNRLWPSSMRKLSPRRSPLPVQWLGRLRYLRYLLTASMLEEADNPEEVRRAMLQASFPDLAFLDPPALPARVRFSASRAFSDAPVQSAVSTVEHCRGGNCTGEEVAVAVSGQELRPSAFRVPVHLQLSSRPMPPLFRKPLHRPPPDLSLPA